jgi:hypothetical protein
MKEYSFHIFLQRSVFNPFSSFITINNMIFYAYQLSLFCNASIHNNFDSIYSSTNYAISHVLGIVIMYKQGMIRESLKWQE